MKTRACLKCFVNDCSYKTNKICVNHGGEFYNRLVKSWLQRKDNEIYSTQKENNLILIRDLIGP